MGKPFRRWCWLALLCALLLSAPALAAASPALTVASLDADPEPERVLRGEFDSQFIPATGPPAIREGLTSPHWWRITATADVPADGMPQLALLGAHLNQVELWRPGDQTPLRRATIGPDADLNSSTRAISVPLPQGLATGQSIYLRIDSISSVPNSMPIAIESAVQAHAKDMRHVTWRTVILTTMAVVAILALGFWIGIGERGYAFLAVTLLAQMGYLVSVGGEGRAVPWLREIVATEPLASRSFMTIAIIAGIPFFGYYLGLPQRQPRLMLVLKIAMVAFVVLLFAGLVSSAPLLSLLSNPACVGVALLVLIASIRSLWWGERPARFLLLSWLPFLALIGLRVGEWLGWWPGMHWVTYAFPASFALSGLILIFGLADKMQQLRRDRDLANHLASYDGLTGASSRAMIERQLTAAVAHAHKTGELLSIVFLDIDRFKPINDEHGHLVGDQYLRVIALRAHNRLRINDVFGRYGGDEMLVILPRTGLAEAVGIAENLRSAVNCRPLSIDGKLFNATLSLGVAQLARGESVAQLLERADAALYASKSAGRDRVSSLVNHGTVIVGS